MVGEEREGGEKGVEEEREEGGWVRMGTPSEKTTLTVVLVLKSMTVSAGARPALNRALSLLLT